jgi:glucokinase
MSRSIPNKSKPVLILGIDIGGTFVKAGVINQNLKIEKKMEFPTHGQLPTKDLLNYWLRMIRQLLAGLLPQKVKAIGFGIPGTLDRKTGKIIAAPNLKNLQGVAVAEFFERNLGLSVSMDNDVNCFTLGEYELNWRARYKNMLALTLGTGIGGGLILDGQLYRGNGNAGEFGHISLDFHGRQCLCGSLGCFEQYASAQALTNFVRSILHNDYAREGKKYPEYWHEFSMQYPAKGPGDSFYEAITGKVITQGAKLKDPLALTAFAELGRYLGIGCATLANSLDPEIIVIGGGIRSSHGYFLPEARREFDRRAMRGIRENVKIIPARGSASAVIGCALLAS